MIPDDVKRTAELAPGKPIRIVSRGGEYELSYEEPKSGELKLPDPDRFEIAMRQMSATIQMLESSMEIFAANISTVIRHVETRDALVRSAIAEIIDGQNNIIRELRKTVVPKYDKNGKLIGAQRE